LEKLVLTRHEVLFKQQVDAQWAFLVHNGLWMEPLREDLDALINKTQERVNGEVKVKLYKGGLLVVGRSSPMALYDPKMATYEAKTTFNQAYAEGFIELWGLPTKTYHIVKNKTAKKKIEKI
jgi:argininosuccinate synthase